MLGSLSLATTASATPGVPSNGRVSFGEFFSETNQNSVLLGLTDDARYATYHSNATNITDEDTTLSFDVYRYDRLMGITLLMSVGTNGKAGNVESFGQVSSRMISADGRYVLFSSSASNLIAGDTNNNFDAFIRDTNGFGSTQRVTLGPGGAQIPEGGGAAGMSSDATKILFLTTANLVPGDTNGIWDA